MIIANYLHDLNKWEVVRIAERFENDERLGLYEDYDEAIIQRDKFIEMENETSK